MYILKLYQISYQRFTIYGINSSRLNVTSSNNFIFFYKDTDTYLSKPATTVRHQDKSSLLEKVAQFWNILKTTPERPIIFGFFYIVSKGIWQLTGFWE